jgi:hypothetical protein
MEKIRRSPWLMALIAGIALVFICICAVALGGGAAYLFLGSELPETVEINLGSGQETATKKPQVVPTKQTAQAIKPATPVKSTAALEKKPTFEKPTPPKPTPPKPTPKKTTSGESPKVSTVQKDQIKIIAQEGDTVWGETYLFEDCTTDLFLWFSTEENCCSSTIKDGKCMMKAKGADTVFYNFFPGTFIQNKISFDVRDQEGSQSGIFGVDCQGLFPSDRYVIEFDLGKGEYSIGKAVGFEVVPLTKKNQQGKYSQKTQLLKTSPSVFNHIDVICNLNSISLSINNEQVENIDIKDPLPEPGKAEFYVRSNKIIKGDGYEVTLDNIEVSE